MGKPIRILDLAHDMIRLCGYEPDVDIKVSFTGTRPGEKLHEALTTDEELLGPALHDGLSVVRRPEGFTQGEVMDLLRQCQQIVSRGDQPGMHEFLCQAIPGFESRTFLGRTASN